MNILIQFPTYKRRDKAIHVLEKYIDMSGDSNTLFFNVNCDAADWTMTDAETVRIIRALFNKKSNINGTVWYDKNTTKISAINDHINKEFDILVCASDDMVPVVPKWDEEISSAMKEFFPNLDGCVHFDDGNTKGELITFSILGKKLYEHFGYIYHPDYKSLYCDNEFTDQVRSLGKEKFINKKIISHEHWSIKGSENYNQQDEAVIKTLTYSGRDKEVYEYRKRHGFPIARITYD